MNTQQHFIDRETKQQWMQNNLPIDLEDEWLTHMGSSPRFKRDVGFPQRFPVETEDKFMQEVWDRLSDSNTYTGVYSYRQIKQDRYDTAYIDLDVPLDCPDDATQHERTHAFETAIETAFWEVKKIVWYMQEEYQTVPRVYFSGSRGFSVYLDFPEQQIDFQAVVAATKNVLNEADVELDYVDHSVFENNRISRLPYTLNWNNVKRGMEPLFCLPINPTWDFERVIDEIKTPEEFLSVERNPSAQFGHFVEEIDEYENYDNPGSQIDAKSDPGPQPEKAMQRAATVAQAAPNIKDGRHRTIHFVLVPSLIEAGWEPDDIHDFCREFLKDAPGASYHNYREYIEESIDRTLQGPSNKDTPWRSHNLETFIADHPELEPYFEGVATEGL